MNENNQPSAKKDVYTIVTEHIVAQLEKGAIPWRKPWTDGKLPQNFVSKRPHRSINIWLLSMLGYGQNYFLTYKQIQDLDGKVKRGETGYLVVYWKYNKTQTEDLPEGDQVKKQAILRYYNGVQYFAV